MSTGVSLAWLAAGGVFAGLCVGRQEVPAAMWIGPAILLHVARHTAPGIGLGAIGVVLYLGAAVANAGVLPFGGIAYLAAAVGVATVTLLPFVADRLLAPGVRGFGSTLVFPLAFVVVEFARMRLVPSGSWGLGAYTQYGNLPLMQVASVAGLTGITFLVTWTAAVVNWAWDHDFAPATVGAGLAACGAVLAIVILAGTIRLTRTPTDVPSVRVAAISYPRELFERGEVTRIIRSEVRDDEERVLRDKVRRLQDWFVERTSSEARAGARIVVWPELNLLVFKEDEPAFLERARRLAAEERIYLLMGMAAVHPGTTKPLENKAVLVNPSGSTEFAYHKSHLMPGWEARLVAAGGLRMPIATTSYGRVGAAICADGDYPDFIRQAGQGAADLLLLPTNDWAEIKNVHLHMAVFRAIENGMPVVRATSTGFSAVIDALGRVVAMTDHFAPGVHVTVAQVPLRRVETIYARVGDLFSWLCVAALAVLAAISRVQG